MTNNLRNKCVTYSLYTHDADETYVHLNKGLLYSRIYDTYIYSCVLAG